MRVSNDFTHLFEYSLLISGMYDKTATITANKIKSQFELLLLLQLIIID